MANRTVKDAKSIRGTNPQHLVEKIIRSRVYDCRYWKEECFALTGNPAQNKLNMTIKCCFFSGAVGGQGD
jgi:pre-mRNA-splicing factor 38A